MLAAAVRFVLNKSVTAHRNTAMVNVKVPNEDSRSPNGVNTYGVINGKAYAVAGGETDSRQVVAENQLVKERSRERRSTALSPLIRGIA